MTTVVRIHYEIDDELSTGQVHRRPQWRDAEGADEKAITEYVERAEKPGNPPGRAKIDPGNA